MPGRRKHDRGGSARNYRRMASGSHHRQAKPRKPNRLIPLGWRSLPDVKADAIAAVAHSDVLTEKLMRRRNATQEPPEG